MVLAVHDNRLISYTVNEKLKTILLETYFNETIPYEYTNVLFSGVLAYFFENHSIPLGTIIFDIEEVPPESILKSNWRRFEEGKKWGWPGGWADTKESALAYFKEHSIKAFNIGASLGLCGWVLAKKIESYSK